MKYMNPVTKQKSGAAIMIRQHIFVAVVLVCACVFASLAVCATDSDCREIITPETSFTEKTSKETTEEVSLTTKAETTSEIIPKTTTAKPTTTEKETTTDYSSYNDLGTFYITVYTPGADGGGWGYQTATGVKSEHLATCAVDPSVIPLGSVIEVNGLILKAVDTGGAIKGNHIDIFYDGTSSEAINWVSNFGIYNNVYIIS